jgi:hypothetical protein
MVGAQNPAVNADRKIANGRFFVKIAIAPLTGAHPSLGTQPLQHLCNAGGEECVGLTVSALGPIPRAGASDLGSPICAKQDAQRPRDNYCDHPSRLPILEAEVAKERCGVLGAEPIRNGNAPFAERSHR